MNNRSSIIPYAEVSNEGYSIREISRRVILFYKGLSNVNDSFRSIFNVSEKEPRNDHIDIWSNDAESLLAEEILLQNIDDIIKLDEETNVDLDYVRAGKYINFSLGTREDEESLLTLSFSFIVSNRMKSKIGTLVAKDTCFQDLSDCLFFLEQLDNSFNVEYSSMKVSFFERAINREIRKYRSPLGFVTFYSDKTYGEIPCNFPELECKVVENGRILILKDSDLFQQEPDLRLNVTNLLSIMKKIESIYPSFLR